MEAYERNLIIALCLGTELSGSESKTKLEEILDRLNSEADGRGIQPLQEDLAEWLKLPLENCNSQQDASLKLWKRIDERGYGLADVPTKIRRKVFGGSLDIQKRMGRRPLHVRLLRRVSDLARTIGGIAVLVGVIWLIWKFFVG